MKIKNYLYTNTEMAMIIDEYIHSSRDREILKLCFMDNISYEVIGEKVGLTPRQVSNVVRKGSIIIAERLEKRGQYV